MSIKFYSLIFASLLFFACADESPTSSVQENIDEKAQQKEREQREEDCYYGTSNYSDSWCCTNYGYQCKQSSSSKKYSSSYTSYYYSSSSKKISSSSYRSNNSSSSKKTSNTSATSYITTSKNIKLTLTYFKQVTPDWDNVLNMKNYADADPRVYFEIQFRDRNGKKSSQKTKNLLEKQDTGEWEGRVDYATIVPAYTDSIYIYPHIVDADVLANDDYSSGYGYGVHSIGYMDDYEVWYQSDEENKKCILEWEWYLY